LIFVCELSSAKQRAQVLQMQRASHPIPARVAPQLPLAAVKSKHPPCQLAKQLITGLSLFDGVHQV